MSHHGISRIIHHAQKVIDCVSRTLETPPPQKPAHLLNLPPAIQKPNLPSAENYLTLIQHRDLPTGILERCHAVLQDMARKTHEIYDRTVRLAGAELSDNTINALCHALENQYQRQSVQVMQRVDKYLTKELASEKYVPVDTSSKSIFNHKCTPLLEQYFECNAYPSRSDKALLAKRTRMTQRQIDVWFQNHRTRAKRDGRPLRRPVNEGMSALAPNVLNMDNGISLQRDYSPVASSDSEIEESESDSQVFAVDNKERRYTILDTSPYQTPPYAFPALYRPHDKQDLIIIPPVNWERTPSVHKRSYNPIDMDDFVSSFASKLSLGARDSINIPRGRKSKQVANGCPWFESRRTIPAAAPLTALVRSQKSGSENLERHCMSAQRRSHPYGARWTSIGKPGHCFRSCHRLRPSVKNNRRRSSSSSTSSYSSSGTSEDTSSGNELLTPPASPFIPPQFFAKKAIPFDVFGWGSDSP